jgi:hypothetical protein
VFKDKKPGEIKLSKDEVPGLGEFVPNYFDMESD